MTFHRDLEVSAYLPMLVLGLILAKEGTLPADDQRIAARWLCDVAEAVRPFLEQVNDGDLVHARMLIEEAIHQFRIGEAV